MPLFLSLWACDSNNPTVCAWLHAAIVTQGRKPVISLSLPCVPRINNIPVKNLIKDDIVKVSSLGNGQSSSVLPRQPVSTITCFSLANPTLPLSLRDTLLSYPLSTSYFLSHLNSKTCLLILWKNYIIKKIINRVFILLVNPIVKFESGIKQYAPLL